MKKRAILTIAKILDRLHLVENKWRDKGNKSKVLILLCVAIWSMQTMQAMQVVQAVAITEGVVLDPPGLTKYVWDCVYEDDKSLICAEAITGEGIKVGGIYCVFDPTTELTIIVHAWNPENKGEPGEIVFDLSTIAQQAGSFEATFENLIPKAKYEIYKNGDRWKVVKADEHGKLKFADRVGSENRYVIKCLTSPVPTPTPTPTATIPPIPPIPPPPIPGFEALFAIAGLAGVAYLLGRRE